MEAEAEVEAEGGGLCVAPPVTEDQAERDDERERESGSGGEDEQEQELEQEEPPLTPLKKLVIKNPARSSDDFECKVSFFSFKIMKTENVIFLPASSSLVFQVE